jgi:hypothetical protein
MMMLPVDEVVCRGIQHMRERSDKQTNPVGLGSEVTADPLGGDVGVDLHLVRLSYTTKRACLSVCVL